MLSLYWDILAPAPNVLMLKSHINDPGTLYRGWQGFGFRDTGGSSRRRPYLWGFYNANCGKMGAYLGDLFLFFFENTHHAALAWSPKVFLCRDSVSQAVSVNAGPQLCPKMALQSLAWGFPERGSLLLSMPVQATVPSCSLV